MALETHRWTRADLERLPNDGNKYEVIHGELLVSPAPRPAHVYIQEALFRLLLPFCDALGLYVSIVSAFVSEDSETIPDTVVRQRVMPPPERWDDAPVPVLVVEVLSRSTKRNDEVKKRAFYMEAGAAEYWIIDGKARSLRVITSSSDRVEAQTVRWSPPGTSASLDIDLPRFFSQAIGDEGQS